jgi:hypothetical protein
MDERSSGVCATEQEMRQLMNLWEGKDENLEKTWKLCTSFAISHGLPELPEGCYYGISEFWEFVRGIE